MARPSSEVLHQLIQAIRDADWPEQALTYFAEARTETCTVNPYWPRAFLLALASMYLPESPPYRYADSSRISRHIAELDAISHADKGADTIEWILELPDAYRTLWTQPVIDMLWGLYKASIDLDRCRSVASEAASMVVERMGISSTQLPDIVVTPNPLQAPEATDFVSLEDKVYLIKAEPDVSSCVHEILHHAFSPAIKRSRSAINKFAHLLAPIRDDMLHLAYAWDDSEESWHRVFEEHLMRAAEIWVDLGDDPESVDRAAAVHAGYGFKYVPAITKCFQSNWSGMNGIEDFIVECLRACQGHRE